MKISSRLSPSFIAAILLTAILMLTAQTSHAASAAWNLNPATGDWNTATNWTPATVPNGSADTATFALSNMTSVSISANAEVNGIVFNAGASAFTITASPTSGFTLAISGVGITNNSGITQNFVTVGGGAGTVGAILFANSATAGINTAFTNDGGAVSGAGGGYTILFFSSTAGSGTFTNNGGTASGAGGGSITFREGANAGSGTCINNGGTVSGAFGGSTFSTTSAPRPIAH